MKCNEIEHQIDCLRRVPVRVVKMMCQSLFPNSLYRHHVTFLQNDMNVLGIKKLEFGPLI